MVSSLAFFAFVAAAAFRHNPADGVNSADLTSPNPLDSPLDSTALAALPLHLPDAVMVWGGGVVGRQVASLLVQRAPDTAVYLRRQRDPSGHPTGDSETVRVVAHGQEPDVALAVLCGDAAGIRDAQRWCCDHAVAFVMVGDDPDAIADVLRYSDGPGVVGVGMCPGLSTVLAVHGAQWMDQVDEVHVAQAGAAGWACARQRTVLARAREREWRDGGWVDQPVGSGRELRVFPEPIGVRDCYRTAGADPVLLQRLLPEVSRVSLRVALNRSQRFVPSRPGPARSGGALGPGAVTVEVRGRRAGREEFAVLGVTGSVAAMTAAAAVGAASALWTRMAYGEPPTHPLGFAELLPSSTMLSTLSEFGITPLRFDPGRNTG